MYTSGCSAAMLDKCTDEEKSGKTRRAPSHRESLSSQKWVIEYSMRAALALFAVG